jgi:carbon storage regulator
VLVLTRRRGEKVVLPGLGVTVQVLGVRGSAVRLGIVAPREVTVLREEVAGRPRPKGPERCAR